MPLFVMIGRDGPDGQALRNEHRAAHLAHLDSLDDRGKITFAGPLRNGANDLSVGAVIVFEAESLDDAKKLVDADPFVQGGVFQFLDVAPIKKVYPRE